MKLKGESILHLHQVDTNYTKSEYKWILMLLLYFILGIMMYAKLSMHV